MGNTVPVRQVLTQLTKDKKAKALVEKIQKKSASANYSSIEILSIVFPTEVIYFITIITAAFKLVSDIIKALVCQLGKQTQKF